MENLSPIQEKVLASIAAGDSASAAAAAAGIHRNTVGNWVRSSSAFRLALVHAQEVQQLHWREQAETRVAAAFATIDQIMADPEAPAGVRARLALAIIQIASTPIEAQDDLAPAAQDPGIEEDLEFADPCEPVQLAAGMCNEKPENLHNSAQSTPKIGRNQPCPCGSGRKYKFCCLGKPHRAAA